MNDAPASPLPVVDLATIRDRLDALLSEVDAVEGASCSALATDGDGTLWTSDVGEALFHEVLRLGLVGPPARAALLAEADGGQVAFDPGDDAATLARRLWDAYLAGRYPEDRMCAAMTWCMAGQRVERIAAVAREMLEGAFDLRGRLVREALGVVEWALSRGVEVWLVSASPRMVVAEAAVIVAHELRAQDVLGERILAMAPAVEGGVIAPRTLGEWTYGEGKARALLAALGPRTLLAALGDNVFDAAMLRAAEIAIAVRPKPALMAVADEVPGMVLLGG